MRGQAVNSRDVNGSAYFSDIETGLSTENFNKVAPPADDPCHFFY